MILKRLLVLSVCFTASWILIGGAWWLVGLKGVAYLVGAAAFVASIVDFGRKMSARADRLTRQAAAQERALVRNLNAELLKRPNGKRSA